MINIIDKIEVRSATSYANWLYTFIADMFKWELDFAPEWVPEFLLTRYGAAAVMYNDGDPVIVGGGYCGKPTRYEMGDSFTGATLDGKVYKGKIGEDCAVIWNNPTMTPDTYTLASYAERFAERDRSELNVLRGTRITNLVTASDNTDSATLDKVVKAITDGDVAVKIPPIYREIDALDSGAKRFDILRLTDPKDTDKLQYLARQRDSLLAAFLAEYGLEYDMVDKGSQIVTGELHAQTDMINAIVQSRLDCRRRNLDIVRGWGVNIDVQPNRARGCPDPSVFDKPIDEPTEDQTDDQIDDTKGDETE